MKFLLAFVSVFFATNSYAARHLDPCAQFIPCGSYHGLTVASDGNGNELQHWDEVVAFSQGRIDSQVNLTFALTYPDGSQEAHEFVLGFKTDGSFDIFYFDTKIGSGSCANDSCTYSYGTQNGNATGDFSFADNKLVRHQTQTTSNGGTVHISQTLDRQ